MPKIEPISFYYTRDDIINALNNFSDRFKEGKVKEKLAYAIWRDLKTCIYGVLVENWVDSAGREKLVFFESDRYGDKTREVANLLIYENMFALFFFENYFLQHPDYRNEGDYDEMPPKYYYSNVNTSDIAAIDNYNSIGLQYTTAKNETTTINEKEKKNMKGFNFDFGPCTGDNVRVSMYGIAVKNQNNEWVSYNPETAQIVNVDIFNFEGGKYLFKMPVAPKDVAIGDVIIHNKKAMFVIELDENGFIVVDVNAGEEKKVVPTSNVFGFNFITKVVSMFNAFAEAPSTDAPFGNMLPFMLMSENKDIDPIMLMFMMNGNNMGDMFSNPMMLYFLCGDKMNKDSMLPLMMLMNQNKAPKGKGGK